MNYVLDILVVAIVLICVLISSKKGFVRTLISAVGFVAAIILAVTLSGPISTSVANDYIKPAVEEKTASILSETAGNSLNTAAGTLWEELPSFVVGAAASAGVTEESLGQSILESTANTAEGLASDITNKLFMPIVENLLKGIVMFLLFLILMILVSILSRVLNKLFSGKVFGKFNRTLGGVLGAVKGLVFAVIFCVLISVFVGFSENGFLSITQETINSTYIFSKILEIVSF